MNSSPLARRSMLAATAAAALLLVAACGDSGGESGGEGGDDALGLINPGTLTACSEVPYPPFEVEDAEAPSGYSGFDIDLLQAIADELELDLAVEDVSFEALQSGTTLAADQCDIGASAITITPEREENLTFSEPYYDSLQSLLVAPDSGIESIADLDGVNVGVQAGTTGMSYAEENAEGATLVEYPGNSELWSAIQAGQIDAILQDLPVNVENAKADPAYVIVEEYSTDEQYGYAMDGDAPEEFVTAINDALQTLRDDGTYQDIYDSYFAVEPQ
ncbi:amino acid ABC transporter substrate-binding protein, PAAT family [Georgenia satyanarayanai]|uniref:Amino acid ABC transporter substrate-binding protein, PAAT family n=1 Tax=Georgenia satyanarayanai TaxID=860221 RepID=A0A2Y9APX9_9MICO|nr:ABC transporter substrate-binding protein [Georgenia satyanarayanai]PYF96713.1 amino acid ABC transporter substrate-binding protein (PAAT family) [Georgenia satyanarayanai]SSA46454.1 amino acid ABC transporter substrate-binding protein, PAAT family [Georgenia satyanarayanai]